MTQCDTTDMQTYLERLQTSEQELHALIEEVIVPETWFFRDQVPFTYLGRYVMAEWLSTHQHAVLRVLSVACSSGEEPYSIAMALLDTGLAPQHFRIDAVDISRQALGRAQRAVYGHNSFRGEDLMFRERYLEPHEAGYQVHQHVRNIVRLMHGNILEARFLADQEPYDVIFCRNMLTYFDNPAKSQAIKVLERLLAPHGVLFVGYTEMGLLLASGYAPVRYPRAFAYRKAEARHDRQQPPQPGSLAQPQTPCSHGNQTASRRQRSPHSSTPVATSRDGSEKPPDTYALALETARRLANQGDLDTAARLCETSMRDHGPSAQAYFLQGLIRQTAGNLEQAVHDFNRAIYLHPDHYEALIHLALLTEHRGDTAGAAVLRQRARRAGAPLL